MQVSEAKGEPVSNELRTFFNNTFNFALVLPFCYVVLTRIKQLSVFTTLPYRRTSLSFVYLALALMYCFHPECALWKTGGAQKLCKIQVAQHTNLLQRQKAFHKSHNWPGRNGTFENHDESSSLTCTFFFVEKIDWSGWQVLINGAVSNWPVSSD